MVVVIGDGGGNWWTVVLVVVAGDSDGGNWRWWLWELVMVVSGGACDCLSTSNWFIFVDKSVNMQITHYQNYIYQNTSPFALFVYFY